MANEDIRITMIAFDPEWEKENENIERLDMAVRSLPDFPDILVLPECFSTGFAVGGQAVRKIAESDTLAWMKSISDETGSAVAGSVPVEDECGKFRNRFFFVEPSGKIISYDKHFLYFGNESGLFTRGTENVPFEWKGWKILPGVCFDIRFPEWMRNTYEEPYDLYLNVANWPVSRKKAAEVLVKARAVENVSYVAFCNRSGRDQLLEYDGESYIVNYRGRDKAARQEVCGLPVYTAVLEKESMLRFRESFPVLEKID